MLVAKSFHEARKDRRWGKITPIEIGITSNVDKPGRGKTSCSTARGGARMKIWVSWAWVRLHDPCMCLLFTLTRCVPFVTSHSTQDEKADAVRRCSVTGSAPVAWSKDGQLLATELLLFGARCPDPDQCSCVLWHCSWQNKHSWTQFGSLRLPQHTCVVSCATRLACCVARILGMWWNTSGSMQQAVGNSQYERQVSLVFIISAALFYIQPVTYILLCATVLYRLGTNGYLPGDSFREHSFILFGGCLQ